PFRFDRPLARLGKALSQVAHLKCFDMGTQLRCVLGEVAVHVQHSRVSVAQETDAAPPQSADCRSGTGPGFNLLPRALGIWMRRNSFTILAALDTQHSCDQVEIDPAPGE